MRGIHDRIIRQRRIRHDKVLLRRLQRLDETKIRIIKDAIGIFAIGGNEGVGGGSGVGEVFFFEEFVGFFVAEVGADGTSEFVVFFLEEGDGLLEGFEEELFADSGSFGVFSVAFPVVVVMSEWNVMVRMVFCDEIKFTSSSRLPRIVPPMPGTHTTLTLEPLRNVMCLKVARMIMPEGRPQSTQDSSRLIQYNQ